MLVVDRLALETRVLLLGCSARLGRLVASCAAWWERIAPSPRAAARLRDAQLAALLERVDGKRATRRLELRGCKLTGEGLAPLRGSDALEEVDLRCPVLTGSLPGPPKLDADRVSSILLTCSALRTFRFLESSDYETHFAAGPHRSCAARPLQAVRLAIHTRRWRAAGEPSACDFCAGSRVGREWRYETCARCGRRSCRGGGGGGGGGVGGVGGIVGGGDAHAGPRACPPMVACSFCAQYVCESCCETSGSCDECFKQLCGGDECGGVSRCDVCRDTFCSKCRKVARCDACGAVACSSCTAWQRCDCGRLRCDGCVDPWVEQEPCVCGATFGAC